MQTLHPPKEDDHVKLINAKVVVVQCVCVVAGVFLCDFNGVIAYAVQYKSDMWRIRMHG